MFAAWQSVSQRVLQAGLTENLCSPGRMASVGQRAGRALGFIPGLILGLPCALYHQFSRSEEETTHFIGRLNVLTDVGAQALSIAVGSLFAEHFNASSPTSMILYTLIGAKLFDFCFGNYTKKPLRFAVSLLASGKEVLSYGEKGAKIGAKIGDYPIRSASFLGNLIGGAPLSLTFSFTAAWSVDAFVHHFFRFASPFSFGFTNAFLGSLLVEGWQIAAKKYVFKNGDESSFLQKVSHTASYFFAGGVLSYFGLLGSVLGPSVALGKEVLTFCEKPLLDHSDVLLGALQSFTGSLLQSFWQLVKEDPKLIAILTGYLLLSAANKRYGASSQKKADSVEE